MFLLIVCFLAIAFNSPVHCNCKDDCDLPINIYEQLKCTPVYNQPLDCCPQEYNCSHLYKRPEGTCHFRGKLYKLDETVTDEDIAESCHINCHCNEKSTFTCLPPQQNCHEYYLSDYPKEGCYLQYALDKCCASNQVCPPFENIRECEVDGKVYKEGQRFPHPTKKCTKCVCSKGFDGKFTAPDCQRKNCSTEIRYSKEIDKSCAPYYIGGTCCPAWWICPADDGEYIPAANPDSSKPKCKFGQKIMDIGSKYTYQDKHTAKLICECVVPPFLSCFEQQGE